jgi:PAS domain S-box-containing protein
MRVLHLEDSPDDAELVAARLAGTWPDIRVHRVANRDEFETALQVENFDVILSDYTMAGYDGLSALEAARVMCPRKPFIFLSGTIGEERAIEALKRGATDYVIKDRPSRLVPAIRQALDRAADGQRHRQTEEALRQNRERFRIITENVADLIIMLDPAGHCLYANPAYSAVVGRESGCVGCDVFNDIHPEDREAMRELFRTAARQGTGGQVDCRFLHSDGSVRHVEAQASVARDAAGAVAQVLLVGRDVTERHRAEEQIRRQAALLDLAQDAILVRDLDNRITYWNRAAARLYELNDDQPRGRTAGELWTEDPARIDVARRATMFYGEWMGEIRQRTTTGAELLVQSRWSLVQDRHGAPAGFLIINTDVGEKKRLEAQMLRVQRMESIGLLAGGVAHDINNVLVPIMVSSELLEPMVAASEGKAFLASIRASAQHGAALVRQLLAFARGAAGQPADLQLRPLLGDFIGFITQTLPRGITFTLDVPKDPWIVRGDATQLKQVLMNLCLNARDAMGDHGRIMIRAANRMLTETEAAALREVKAGPHVEIAVADSGCGMPPEVVARIFDPFFTTKEIGKGTGLGLAAVRGIVKGHDGAISVESEPGQGTTFRIFLPAAHASGGPGNGDSREAGGGDGQQILLIDDETSVRDVLAALLMTSGYRVIKAASGVEGLATYAARRAEIAVVITDIMMSGIDGFAVIRGIRAQDPGVPIIAMSGMASAGCFDEQAKELNAALLAKPLTQQSLLSAVRAALEPSYHPPAEC